MLEYAVKLTLDTWELQRADVERLRQPAFHDAEILDINQITGYFLSSIASQTA